LPARMRCLCLRPIRPHCPQSASHALCRRSSCMSASSTPPWYPGAMRAIGGGRKLASTCRAVTAPSLRRAAQSARRRKGRLPTRTITTRRHHLQTRHVRCIVDRQSASSGTRRSVCKHRLRKSCWSPSSARSSSCGACLTATCAIEGIRSLSCRRDCSGTATTP
jgi:hypothetical protein